MQFLNPIVKYSQTILNIYFIKDVRFFTLISCHEIQNEEKLKKKKKKKIIKKIKIKKKKKKKK